MNNESNTQFGSKARIKRSIFRFYSISSRNFKLSHWIYFPFIIIETIMQIAYGILYINLFSNLPFICYSAQISGYITWINTLDIDIGILFSLGITGIELLGIIIFAIVSKSTSRIIHQMINYLVLLIVFDEKCLWMFSMNFVLYIGGSVQLVQSCSPKTLYIPNSYNYELSNALLHLLVGLFGFLVKFLIWSMTLLFTQDSNPASIIPMNYQGTFMHIFNIFIKAFFVFVFSFDLSSYIPRLLFLIAILSYIGIKLFQTTNRFSYLFYIDLTGKIAVCLSMLIAFYFYSFGDSTSLILSSLLMLPFIYLSIVFLFSYKKLNLVQTATLSQVSDEGQGLSLIYELCDNLKKINQNMPYSLVFGNIELHDKLCPNEFCISHKISSKGRMKDKHSKFVKAALKARKAFIPIYLFASEAESTEKIGTDYRPSAFHMFFSDFFTEILNKFNKETSLCLCNAWFEYKLRSHPFVSLQLLSMAEKQKPSLFYQYEICHLRWLIEASLLETQRKALQITTNKLTSDDILIYLKESNKALDSMEECTSVALDIWRILLNENITPQAISENGFKLMKLISEIDYSVKKAQKSNPNCLGFLFKYCIFLKVVLHYEKRCMDNFAEIKNRFQRIHIMKKTGLSLHQIEDDAAIFRVSGEREKMGKILDCTYNVKNLEMERSDLLGRQIQMIMPPNVGDQHNKFIKYFLNNLKTKKLRKNTKAFARGSNDYFFPINLYIMLSPFIGAGIEFVGFVSKREKSIEIYKKKINTINTPLYLLFNHDYRLIGVSEGSAKIFFISARFLKEQSNIQIMLSTIFEVQCQSGRFESEIEKEEGKIINFDYKHLKDMFASELNEEAIEKKVEENQDEESENEEGKPTSVFLWIQMKKEELGYEESEETLYSLTVVPLTFEEKLIFESIISGDISNSLGKIEAKEEENQNKKIHEAKMDTEVTSTFVDNESVSSNSKNTIQIKNSLDLNEEPSTITTFRYFAAISQAIILLLIVASFAFTKIEIDSIMSITQIMFYFSSRIMETSRFNSILSLLNNRYEPNCALSIPSNDFEMDIKKLTFIFLNKSHFSNSQIQLLSSTLDPSLADFENKILFPSNYGFNSGKLTISSYKQSFSSLFFNFHNKARQFLNSNLSNYHSQVKDSILIDEYYSNSYFIFYNYDLLSRVLMDSINLLYQLRIEGIDKKLIGLYIMYSIAMFISILFCIIILARAIIVVKQKTKGFIVFSFLTAKEIKDIVNTISITNIKNYDFHPKYIKDPNELSKVFAVVKTGHKEEEDEIEKLDKENISNKKQEIGMKTDSNNDESSVILLNREKSKDQRKDSSIDSFEKQTAQIEENSKEAIRQKKREAQLNISMYRDICGPCIVTIISTILVLVALGVLILLANIIHFNTKESNRLDNLMTFRRVNLNNQISIMLTIYTSLTHGESRGKMFVNTFSNFFNQSLEIENTIVDFSKSGSTFFANTQSMISSFNSKLFCDILKANCEDYSLNICKSNTNLSSLGLRSIIYDELNVFETAHTAAEVSAFEVMQSIFRLIEFEYHLVVTEEALESIISTLEKDISNFYFICQIVEIILVVVYSIMMLILYFVAYRYVINRLKEEILLSKCVLNIVPIDFISKNELLKKAFNKNSKL